MKNRKQIRTRILAYALTGILLLACGGTGLAEAARGNASPADTPEKAAAHYTFQPKVCSIYMEEIFGRDMCEAWFSLVDAVMAGEDTFQCKDQYTYSWVMGQFPNKCFPILTELIDYAYDRSHAVKDGVARFTYLVPPEEARARIGAFAEQIEGILNQVLEDDYSDFEKALALYEYFSDTYTYDYETAQRTYETYVDDVSAYRFFEGGTGICHEISTAYSYLLMQARVEATTMMGPAHEWSYVRINGQNYHIDPTFVITHRDSLAYFMMSDGQRRKTGFDKDGFIITSNYSQDHTHPAYEADDDTFQPLWTLLFEGFSHEKHTVTGMTESEYGEWYSVDFDYAGY